MKSPRKYPSSTDVARLAGVSQSAVSRAFNEGKSVSEETSRKVFEAAKQLGYSPNFIPRMLLKHRSDLVAIVISDSANPFYAAAVDAFSKALQETGHQVLLVSVDGGPALDGILPRLASYRVDAIVSALPVVTKAAAEAFARLRIPIVSFNTPAHNQWVASVCSDNAGGAALVADLFVKRGAKSFGFIGGTPSDYASEERLRGFRERLGTHGFDRIEIAMGDYLYEDAYKAAAAMAERREVPEALFCANDLMAFGVLDALRRAGLRVPQDVMVAGYDDVPAAAWGSFDLTTVVHGHEAMVAAAIAILHARMADGAEPTDGVTTTVPVSLIERATTRR
ncbi:MAG: LacI family DNA-binding transcriptional regulator [Candidatus Kaistia colombiensis]|nr:MAG: LacI family DNA-binding transcriptional regulator [Kaistia sp.]